MTRQCGISLTETVIALSLGVIIVGIVGHAITGTTRGVDYLVQSSASTDEVNRTLSRLRDELHQSSTDQVTIASTTLIDLLTFKVSNLVGGELEWGAFDLANTWQEGWSVRYRPSGDQLFRDLLDASGQVQGSPESIVRGLLDPVGGGATLQKGLQVQMIDSVVTVTVRVRRSLSDGNSLSDAFTTSVFVQSSSS